MIDKKSLFIHDTEMDFLKKKAVTAYNEQHGMNFKHTDFCIKSIPPAYHCTHGYELLTKRLGDNVKLRLYLNIGIRDSLNKYRLELFPSAYGQGNLQDEVAVAIGTIDRFFLEEDLYRFEWMEGDCNPGYCLLLSEKGEPLLSETSAFLIAERLD